MDPKYGESRKGEEKKKKTIVAIIIHDTGSNKAFYIQHPEHINSGISCNSGCYEYIKTY